jgi:hypothetical protein
MQIIGVAGRAGSGKDTFCNALVNDHGFVKVAYADALKRVVRDVYGFSSESLWGPSELRAAVDRKVGIAPRRALQLVGTEGFRAALDATWLKYIERVISELGSGYFTYTPEYGLHHNRGPAIWTPRGVCISDVRFLNEVHHVCDLGGDVAILTRGYTDPAAATHASEGLSINDVISAGGYVVDNALSPKEEVPALALDLLETIELHRSFDTDYVPF